MKKLKFKKLKGFTLVELIIVITILAILATIAFVSFQSYTKDARDGNRITSLKNIESGLHAFQINTGNYPEPENYTLIQASGTTIGYQGYIGDTISKQIKINKTPLDPFDQTKFIYSSNAQKTKYELLSHLETQNQLSYLNNSYALDYTQRTPKVMGDSIGIVLNTDNSPITLTGIDIVTTSTNYKVILANTQSGIFIGTGGILGKTNSSYSCLRLQESGSKTDGIYRINPDGGVGFDIYCDMSTDDGGWALVGRSGNSCPNLTSFGFTKNTNSNPLDINTCYSIDIQKLYFSQVKYGVTNDQTKFIINYGAIFNTDKAKIVTAINSSASGSDFGYINKGIGACKSREGVGHWYLGGGSNFNSIGHKLGCSWSGCSASAWGELGGIDTRYTYLSGITLFEPCGNLPYTSSYSLWVK